MKGDIMFYQDEMDNALRFGDVLRGFILTSPILNDIDSMEHYKIVVFQPTSCVILSPCCSIGHDVLTLSPLISVRGSFFNNPYFSQNLTRINREMEPQKAFPPHIWERFPEKVKQEKLKEGFSYISGFIYL
jgi:hypothetical protein